uniref:Uncharacterized protein n=1 Tax=Eutreptiella gymnastica TaxID=73025 RepID=A0A7S1IKS0_9EUGL|mmetsp:Transcript_26020/g.46947  ORF Transcript_26020/g.46947 Transcript_26020/m.46947 type:complete len:164 (+) Transcript_26020:30-521(+)
MSAQSPGGVCVSPARKKMHGFILTHATVRQGAMAPIAPQWSAQPLQPGTSWIEGDKQLPPAPSSVKKTSTSGAGTAHTGSYKDPQSPGRAAQHPTLGGNPDGRERKVRGGAKGRRQGLEEGRASGWQDRTGDEGQGMGKDACTRPQSQHAETVPSVSAINVWK